MTLPTIAQLQTMSNKQILELYNSLGGHPPVKRFSDTKTAIKRTTPFLEAALAEQAAKLAPAPKVAKAPRVSLSAQICQLITEGFTNPAIAERLGLVGVKATYPAWNRAMLKRTGRI